MQNLLFPLPGGELLHTDHTGRWRKGKYKIPSHASHSKSHFSKTGFSFKQQNHIDHKTLKGISPSFFCIFFSLFFKVNHKSNYSSFTFPYPNRNFFWNVVQNRQTFKLFARDVKNKLWKELHPRYQVCGDHLSINFHPFFYLYRVNWHVIHKTLYTKEVKRGSPFIMVNSEGYEHKTKKITRLLA